MTPYMHNHQQPAHTSEASTEVEASAQVDGGAQTSPPVAHQAEQAERSVMHPDYHDPDWRYYFGAMAG